MPHDGGSASLGDGISIRVTPVFSSFAAEIVAFRTVGLLPPFSAFFLVLWLVLDRFDSTIFPVRRFYFSAPVPVVENYFPLLNVFLFWSVLTTLYIRSEM